MDKETDVFKDVEKRNYRPLEDMLMRNIAMEKMIARLDEMSINIASGMSITEEFGAIESVLALDGIKPDCSARSTKIKNEGR